MYMIICINVIIINVCNVWNIIISNDMCVLIIIIIIIIINVVCVCIINVCVY